MVWIATAVAGLVHLPNTRVSSSGPFTNPLVCLAAGLGSISSTAMMTLPLFCW